MKHLLVLSFFILVPFFVISQPEDAPFGEVKWGMSKSKVKEVEEQELREKMGRLICTETREFAGYKIKPLYEFSRNKLTKSSHVIMKQYKVKNKVMEDYRFLKKHLTQKYGEPEESREVFKDDRFKGQPDNRGLAISKNALAYYTDFKADGTEIQLALSGLKGQIDLRVVYKSTEYKDLQQMIKENVDIEEEYE